VRRMMACCLGWTMWVLMVSPALAQGLDVTVFVGGAYPVYDERLTLRASAPSVPGVDVTASGSPELRADGGLVFGGAIAFELGILGIEGRLDATDVGFDLSGARYDFRATQPPFAGLTGSLTLGDGRLDAERLYLLSGNVRLRTPGPVGLVVSGGVSLLPDITISGSAPLSLEINGTPPIPGIEPQLHLRAAPGESEHRIGVNGGAGLRFGGGRVAVMAEVRVFYFREYALRFDVEDAPELVTSFLESLEPVRFDPVVVNAQAGLVFKF
jgi:hypothetical protein